MGFWDKLSDPAVQSALLGMTQGFAQAAQPTRVPLGFGAALGMGGAGALQGKLQGYPDYQLKQQEISKNQIGLDQQRAQMKALQDFFGGNGAPSTPMGFPPSANVPAASSPQVSGPVPPSAPPPSPAGGIGSVLPPWMSPEQAKALYLMGGPKALTDAISEGFKPQNLRPGNQQVVGGKSVYTAPQVNDPNKPINPLTGEVNQPYIDTEIKLRQAGMQTPERSFANANASERGRLAALGSTGDTNDPVVASHVANVLNGNETMQQVPQGLRNAVSLALTRQPKESYSPISAARYSAAANRVRQPYLKLPQYELTANGLPYLQRIDAAMKVPGSVSDQDLLDSLTKLNTAGNAITDAQVKIITDGKSWADWAGTIANKFQNGGVLSDNQRHQIQDIAKNIYANYKKGYQPVYDKAAESLKGAGIPEPFWGLPDLNKLSEQAMNAPEVAPAPAPGGKIPFANAKGSPSVDDLVKMYGGR